jgi:NADH-quinone oxidoreductase subunit J
VTPQLIFFLILAVMAIACAVLVISLKKISHRIIAMAFCFFAIAGLYFLLRAEFIGIVQIIVYVGALSILFIFGMMMTDHRNVTFVPDRKRGHKILSFLGVGTLLGLMLYGISTLDFPVNEAQGGTGEEIGIQLYGHYVIAVQGVGILLLAALVGAVVLARKEAE